METVILTTTQSAVPSNFDSKCSSGGSATELHPGSQREKAQVELRKNSSTTIYLTQKEVASRFRVSQATVINWRKKRLLDYFQAPGSTKVLYPVTTVDDFEKRSLHKVEEVIKPKEVARKSPEISTGPAREWRI